MPDNAWTWSSLWRKLLRNDDRGLTTESDLGATEAPQRNLGSSVSNDLAVRPPAEPERPRPRVTHPAPTIQPTQAESWAQRLADNKDYAALAAVPYEPHSDQWWPRVNIVTKVLRKAGAEAVDGILKVANERGYCDVRLVS